MLQIDFSILFVVTNLEFFVKLETINSIQMSEVYICLTLFIKKIYNCFFTIQIYDYQKRESRRYGGSFEPH